MTTILLNIKGLVQAGESFPKFLTGTKMKHLPIIENAYLILKEGRISDYGTMEDFDNKILVGKHELIDAKNRFVLPTFVDAHTHTVFAQPREEEFVDRINGLSYEEIALKGGGILNSARRLQEKSADDLFEDAKKRVEQMIRYGTGTLEIKSGYGLTVEAELKMLRVIKRLKEHFSIPIKATFLAAHAFPKEFKEDHEGYISLIINEMLPLVAQEKLADYIDVFCERNYFSVEEMERILKAGAKYGLKPKVHVNQFTVLGGIEKAIELGAISVDHLEEIDDYDLKIMHGKSCIPTLLPSCSHFIGIPYANARKMINADLPIALASDFNPGTTPNSNMSVVWSLACIKMKLTPEEAFNAITINAAHALELADEVGTISKGKRANIMITKEIPSLAYIPYAFGDQLIDKVIIG
jgi:imidazolonepropionase